MGSDISLPMYLMSVNSRDFVQLVEAVTRAVPTVGPLDTPSSWAYNWLLLKDMDLTAPVLDVKVVKALREAFDSTGVGGDRDDYQDFRIRLDWLERDLIAAPASTAEQVHVRDPERRENRRLVVSGPGFQWHSFGYSLGVLLSEIGRLEDIGSDLIREVDERGFLEVGDLGEDGLGIVTRTVTSIIDGDQGRSFRNDRGGLSEYQQFKELRGLLL